ncbi:DUF3472 domain-containing protein [Leadbetterella byssophila]|nr:DUF3472 domain-containing protein [Leadbetterella byssophila]
MKKVIILCWLALGAKAQMIPIEGNTWGKSPEVEIDHRGIKQWKDGRGELYFFSKEQGQAEIIFYSKGPVDIQVSFQGATKHLKFSGEQSLGVFPIDQVGYHSLVMEGNAESLQGVEVKGIETTFVKDEFYWGRRGPSVHFTYSMPEENVEWLYNEVTVPEGEDVIGSYFMANGFAEGYFGIQVNSEEERRILFSVWSPYQTDDPNAIPEDQRITLLKKGKGVYTGEFGNEGSGGQSFKKHMWKAGLTYSFLTRIRPSEVTGSTEYTSYFKDAETGKWELIASFRRPKTSTYAKRFHSFLENFITETGDQPRKVLFGNTWVRTVNGEWRELTRARFTADATARKGNRLDYTGGAEGPYFYLKNCGFFYAPVELNTVFDREASGKIPQIIMEDLER